MKVDPASALRPQEPTGGHALPEAWRTTFPALAIAIAGLLALHWSTFESIVQIWSRSETFAHGFLVAPITIVLVWQRRHKLASLRPSVDYAGFLLLATAGLVWLVAHAGQVQVVAQYAAVAMIPGMVIALAGRHVAAEIAFPLAFLFLGVPIGEALISPLMDWTADFTVAALRLTGIPVYREGNFFTIPSGNWSVVEGCSGIRYLIASITIGTLFAYITYRRLWKRVVFVILSVIVPIIANWLRAYMIVMIGHLSDGKLAHGVDHLIYGWVFFGFVMLILFWLGSFWRDDPEPKRPEANAIQTPTLAPEAAGRTLPASVPRTVASLVGALGLVAIAPLHAAYLDRDRGIPARLALDAPAQAAGWTIDTVPLTDWRPRYEGEAASSFQVYRKGDSKVALYLGYYPQQRKGAELVTSTNIMVVQKHPVWSNMGESMRREALPAGSVEIRETRLRSPIQRLLVWDWFRVAGRDTTNPYVAKLLFARDRLLDRVDDGAAIILAVPYDEGREAAEETLRTFIRDMSPSIEASLAAVSAAARASGR